MQKVLFDTDPGIDDAMALALIHASPALDLIGMTTVFGNADVETTTANARYLAGRLGVTAPIHKGAASPLVGTRHPSPVHIHGHNGLGDVALSVAPLAPLQDQPAHEFIIDSLRAHPGEITLIAVAPLTNLALALRAAPDIVGLARQVIIMGGAFGWGSRRGNVTPVAEANIFNDAHAADAVMTAGWPVVMVGLDVTASCVLSNADAARLPGDAGRLLFEISRNYAEIYRRFDGIDGCCLHDVAAVAYIIDPGLFTLERGAIRVATEGVALGQTILRPEGQTFPPGAWDNIPLQHVCREVDAPAVVAMLIEHILALADGARG
jgi:purine nucleosidase